MIENRVILQKRVFLQAEFSKANFFRVIITDLFGWFLLVSGFKATLTAKVVSWWPVTHMCFPGFLTPVLTQLFFLKPQTTYLTCFCRGGRQKYPGKKFASTGDQTRNHQVMSPTSSQLSCLGSTTYLVKRETVPNLTTCKGRSLSS